MCHRWVQLSMADNSFCTGYAAPELVSFMRAAHRCQPCTFITGGCACSAFVCSLKRVDAALGLQRLAIRYAYRPGQKVAAQVWSKRPLAHALGRARLLSRIAPQRCIAEPANARVRARIRRNSRATSPIEKFQSYAPLQPARPRNAAASPEPRWSGCVFA